MISSPPYSDCSGAQPLPGSGSGGGAVDSGSGGLDCEVLPMNIGQEPADPSTTDTCDDDVDVTRQDDMITGDCPGNIICT